MKVSVSLPREDVELLDAVAAEGNAVSRSAVLHHAVELLREQRLAREYEVAAGEWVSSGQAAAWSATGADGLDDEAW